MLHSEHVAHLWQRPQCLQSPKPRVLASATEGNTTMGYPFSGEEYRHKDPNDTAYTRWSCPQRSVKPCANCVDASCPRGPRLQSGHRGTTQHTLSSNHLPIITTINIQHDYRLQQKSTDIHQTTRKLTGHNSWKTRSPLSLRPTHPIYTLPT